MNSFHAGFSRLPRARAGRIRVSATIGACPHGVSQSYFEPSPRPLIRVSVSKDRQRSGYLVAIAETMRMLWDHRGPTPHHPPDAMSVTQEIRTPGGTGMGTIPNRQHRAESRDAQTNAILASIGRLNGASPAYLHRPGRIIDDAQPPSSVLPGRDRPTGNTGCFSGTWRPRRSRR